MKLGADQVTDVVVDEDTFLIEGNEYALANLVQLVQDKYNTASSHRDEDERRWLNAYHNYRGIYNKNIKFRDTEKSRVFVKITKTKVVAAFGHLVDILLGTDKFPLAVSETDVPDGIAKYAQIVTEDNLGNSKGPFSSISEMLESSDFLGELRERYGDAKVTGGVGNPQGITITPAKEAAEMMNRLIQDQLESSNGITHLRDALFECALLGTGIIKGPFTTYKEKSSWEMDGEGGGKRVYNPTYIKTPAIEYVSIWDVFLDPDATAMKDVSWVVQRHKLSKDQLRSLASQPLFDASVIKEIIRSTPNYVEKDYELEIRSENSNINTTRDRYEVLEYWGNVDKELLLEAGIDATSESDIYDEIPVNIWVCDGKVLRVALNPFTPTRIPYQVFSYETNPYSIYGIGVAENMEDSQAIMNGHARMAIDNLALSGSLIFDVDESALVAGQKFEVYPGKVFRRQAGMAGQAIYGLKFPNTSVENMQMFDKFRQIADESTGIPSYSHGQTGIQSTTRTASGMSMLMGAASLSIKTVIKGIDEDLLKPLGDAFYNWNYAFYEGDLPIRGDLEVKATGTSSLMQKEVKSQRLLQLLQTTANPVLAPFVKLNNVVKEIAKTMDLDPEEFINDEEQAKLFMMLMNPKAGQEQPAPMGAGQIGNPAMPMEEQFSGTPQTTAPTGNQPPIEGRVQGVPTPPA